jgi:GntR family transcriptional regulator, transcriptional repressor for pyruvate dehydrogenase complex
MAGVRSQAQGRAAPAYERVVDHLRDRIAAGELRPGTRLPPAEDLAAELGMRPSSARDGLRVLAALGLVSVEQGRGTFVAARDATADPLDVGEVSTDLLLHLTEARAVLEPEVAALAAQRADAAAIAGIRRWAERMSQDFRAGRDWVPADLAFHDALYDAAGNPVMAQMLRRTADALVDGRRRMAKDRELSLRACHFHELIASAIAEHKPLLARALMHEHMQDAAAAAVRLQESG